MKLLKNSLIATAITTPIFLISSKADENIDNSIEKIKKYALADFINLTSRRDAEIGKISNLHGEYIGEAYIILFKNSGYSIIRKSDFKIMEVNPFYNTKYELEEYISHDKYIYDRGKIERDYNSNNVGFRKNNINPILAPDNDFINFNNDKLDEAKQNSNKKERIINGMIYADHEIEHSWWFKTISENTYGHNSKINSSYEYLNDETKYYKFIPGYYTKNEEKWTKTGICGYIGISAILQYNELFKSSGYYSEWEIKNFWVTNNNFKNSDFNLLKTKDKNSFNKHFEPGFVPRINDNFIKYLYQKTWFHDGVDRWWKFKYIAESVLNKKYAESKINYSYWGDYTLFGKPWSTIKDYKTPTLLTGYYGSKQDNKTGHVVIAYGVYDDGRFLVNFGWGRNYSQVIVSKEILNHGMNFSINNKSQNKLNKLFNIKGKLVDGFEFSNYLKKEGIIHE